MKHKRTKLPRAHEWRRAVRSVATLSGAFFTGLALPAPETVECPKYLPDRAVDTSSLDGIVGHVVRPGMSEQEKFLALYDFYRRMIYHHRYMGADRREILRAINSYGALLCGSQAATFGVLLRRAGFETRVVQVLAKGYGGHTASEVKYNGRWHGFDTMTAFYVFNRRGEIASFAEMKADPALVRDAVKENRASPEFNLCSRAIEKEQEGIGSIIDKDRPWTLLRWGPGTSLTEFWQEAVMNYRTQRGAYNGYVEPGVLDIQLKPNEEYVRLWGNVGLWLKTPSFAAAGPYHTCGHIDELDTVNFKYFEPYKKTGLPFCRYAYRYYGNGWLEWKPDAAQGHLSHFASAVSNLEPDAETGLLKVADGSKPATLTLPLKSPYALVRVEIDLRLEQSEDGETAVALGAVGMRRGRRRSNLAEIWKKTGSASEMFSIVYDNETNPIYLYDLEVRARGENVRFHVARIRSVFQLNWAALPTLYPGNNTIAVSARTPRDLKNHRLVVTCEWADGKDWSTDRSDTRIIGRLPYDYTLEADVADEKMPRMKRLVMRLDPM